LAKQDAILGTVRLGFPWGTADPFLFCVHHDDAYPAGNDRFGPAASLDGRQLGQDFEGHPSGAEGGWRMYHGEVVPGFPQHPHRGFETVTLVRRGLIDHSDSLGAAARFGGGDLQWVTAGKGIVHSEMFPLLDRQGPNRLELFQIWLNLPAEDKMVDPHFTMLWRDQIPTVTARDDAGKATTILVAAGQLGDAKAPPPPPRSWASRPDSDVAIWTIKLEPGARWTLPPARAGSNRSLYFFEGQTVRIAGQELTRGHGAQLRPDVEVPLENGPALSELLLLQGRPIGQPVAQYGPFVMNTRAEIQQAFVDYQRTQFGGWPWPVDDPVHPRDAGRFAKHADGRVEKLDG
jgi:redox-sensitive bicupin YhaK (pirin superfamily)